MQFALGQELHFSDKNAVAIPWVTVVNTNQNLKLISNKNGVVSTSQFKDGDRLIALAFGYNTDTLVYSSGLSTWTLQVKNHQLGEAVVTAQYDSIDSRKSLNKVRVIDGTEMAARGAITLDDVLKNEINFRVGNDFVLGSSLSIQGVGGEGVLIMVDGVPVVGRLDGNIDLSQINVSQVERVEIVEGPLSVNYGSNAIGGTINIITKAPKTNSKAVSIDTYTESTGHFNGSANVELGWKKQSVKLGFGRNYFDGWTEGDDPFYHQRSNIADSSRAQTWNPKTQYFGDFKFRQIVDKGFIELFGSYFDEEIINRGTPRGVYGETAFDDYYRTRRIDGGLRGQKEFSRDWNGRVVFGYNKFIRNKDTYLTDLTGVESELSADPGLIDTSEVSAYMSRGSMIKQWNPTIQAEFGYDLRFEKATGKRIGADDEIGDYALFATATWKIHPLVSVKPGIRKSYNTRYDAPWVPSLNALYTPFENIQVRASYAMGFRAPSIKELDFDFVDINHNIQGNEDLEAETSQNLALSVKSTAAKFGWELTGYYNDIENLITLAQISGTEYSYVNIGQRRTTGANASITSSVKWADVKLSFATNGVQNKLSNGDFSPLTFSPEVAFQTSVKLFDTGCTLHAYYKYNGKRKSIFIGEDETLSEQYVDAFSNLDLSVSRKLWKDKVYLLVGAKNIFDVTSLNSTVSGGAHQGGGEFLVANGISYFATLKFNFNL